MVDASVVVLDVVEANDATVVDVLEVANAAVLDVQCGNYRIFLSIRFYVKSKLINLNSQKFAI